MSLIIFITTIFRKKYYKKKLSPALGLIFQFTHKSVVHCTDAIKACFRQFQFTHPQGMRQNRKYPY